MWQFCTRVASDAAAQDIIEYGLLAMFISVAAYLTIIAIGGDVQSIYNLIPAATSAAAGAGS